MFYTSRAPWRSVKYSQVGKNNICYFSWVGMKIFIHPVLFSLHTITDFVHERGYGQSSVLTLACFLLCLFFDPRLPLFSTHNPHYTSIPALEHAATSAVVKQWRIQWIKQRTLVKAISVSIHILQEIIQNSSRMVVGGDCSPKCIRGWKQYTDIWIEIKR